MYLKIISVIAFYSLLVSFIGCTSAPKRGNASESANQQEALEKARGQDSPDAREYAAMDAEYRKHNYDAVIKRSRAFLKAYAKSEFLDEVYNLRGLSFIGEKKYQDAGTSLKHAIEATHNDALHNTASYNLAYTYFELGQIEQALQALEPVKIAS